MYYICAECLGMEKQKSDTALFCDICGKSGVVLYEAVAVESGIPVFLNRTGQPVYWTGPGYYATATERYVGLGIEWSQAGKGVFLEEPPTPWKSK